MTILPLETKDLPQLKELQPPDWPDIIPPIEFYLRHHFCHPMKITEGNRIVAIGASYFHQDTVWLAHIIVHPGERNRGLGLTMTEGLVNSVKATGTETIFLVATALGEPVYLKAGFVTEGEYIFFSREGTIDHLITDEHLQPYNDDHRSGILKLDMQVSGEQRERAMQEHLPHALVYTSTKGVEGFYLPTWGDGLIIADHPAAGKALMQERMRAHDKAVLPADNRDGILFLEDNGFKEVKRAKRMRLGKQRSWQPHKLYNRIAGKLG